MINQQKTLELKVGFFVFIGLVFIAVMVVQFGSLGQSFKKFYDLTIEFPNASGLINGSDVQLAGARIGYVAGKPMIARNVGSVSVRLKISQEIVIPRKSVFRIDSSGLLGDRFVDVAAGAGFDAAKFDPTDSAQVLQPGETVRGGELPGIKELMAEGQPLLEELRSAVNEFQQIAASIRGGILSETNQKNVSQTFLNLRTSSENFAEASKGFDQVVKQAQGAVDTTNKTMAETRKIVQAASNGNGLIASLLNDREMADNFRALVVNLRERGVLFYKDTTEAKAKPAEPRRR